MHGFVLTLVSVIHISTCIGLMVTILLQAGKGGGLAGAFGGGSSQTLFGGRGAATFLSRATTALAVTFFLTSLTLGLGTEKGTAGPGKSLIQEEARRRAGERTTPPATGSSPSPSQTGLPAPAPGTTPATGTPPASPGGAPQGGGSK